MKRLTLIALILAFAGTTLHAQNTELNIERSVKVEFNSQKGYSYNVYGTSDPAKRTGWKLMGGEAGTGENIVFFYRSDSDQKVFFKVEAIPSDGGQNPQPPQTQASVIPITGLPPAESSGTYDLGEAIGDTEVRGVYRIGIAPGTDGVVIELPHPGIQEYRQKQIKLSLYRGGTGFGSGKVSLKVRTPDGSGYEPKKLVDNGAKQITDEVIILPATGSKDGRKVIVELFNDTAKTDGSAGGQWVATTAAEAVEPTLAHEWDGANVRLKNADGSWGDWVNLQGQKGDKGERGSSEYEWSGTKIRFKKPDGTWGKWVDLKGAKGGKGDKGTQGSVIAEGIDIVDLAKQLELVKDNQKLNFENARLEDVRLIARNFKGVNFKGANLSDASLLYSNFMDSNLSLTDLWHANLSYANLSNANLKEANLSMAKLSYANLSNANLSNASLKDANLGNADLNNANLSGANLTGANLTGANISGVIVDQKTIIDSKILSKILLIEEILNDGAAGKDLSNANLTGVHLSGVNFRGANLTRAQLIGADLTNANLTNANLTNADLDNTDLTGAKLIGANLASTWPSETFLLGANLTGADLTGADLNRAVLVDANLTDANLTDVNFTHVDLERAIINENTKIDPKWKLVWEIQTNGAAGKDLPNVNFEGAYLAHTNFKNTNLKNANLTNADLDSADLTGANLTGANLTGATLHGTSFNWETIFKNTIMPDGTIRTDPEP